MVGFQKLCFLFSIQESPDIWMPLLEWGKSYGGTISKQGWLLSKISVALWFLTKSIGMITNCWSIFVETGIQHIGFSYPNFAQREQKGLLTMEGQLHSQKGAFCNCSAPVNKRASMHRMDLMHWYNTCATLNRWKGWGERPCMSPFTHVCLCVWVHHVHKWMMMDKK